MNTNGLDRGAMTRSSTTSSETVPWLSTCQAHTHRSSTVSLSSTVPSASHEPHLMLPGLPSSSLAGLYRHQLPELTRQHYQSIYTSAGGTPYPSPALYSTHGQPGGVSPLSPYGMYYQHYQHHAGYSPAAATATGDMQSFSQLIARISQQTQHNQPHLPRPYHPSHVPHQYPASLSSPAGSPGPSTAPHPHTSSVPHAAHYREHPAPIKPESRRVTSRTSPPHTDKPHHRLSPPSHRADHYQGLSTKDLPPPTGTPKESKEFSKSSSDSDYMRHVPGPPRRPLGTTRERTMSGDAYSGVHVKSENTPAKKAKFGPPPPHLHAHHSPTHTVTSATSSMLPPPPPLQPASYTSQPHYPPHFMKGSIIQLANGELKRVEELRTEDFVNSADISPDLKIDSSTVVRIERDEERGTAILGFSVGTQRIQVTVEATMEHPFYVFGRGWSSCSPDRTSRRYGLSCCRLGVGDVCISLTQKEPGPSLTSSSTATTTSTVTSSSARSSSASPDSHMISGRETTRRGPIWSRDEGGGFTRQSPDGSRGHRLPSALPHVGSTFVPQGSAPHIDPRSGEPGSTMSLQGAAPQRKRRWSAPDHLRIDSLQEVTSVAPPSRQTHDLGAPHDAQKQSFSECDTALNPQQAQLKKQQEEEQPGKQLQASKSTESHRNT